jgi:hypothetical protein
VGRSHQKGESKNLSVHDCTGYHFPR